MKNENTIYLVSVLYDTKFLFKKQYTKRPSCWTIKADASGHLMDHEGYFMGCRYVYKITEAVPASAVYRLIEKGFVSRTSVGLTFKHELTDSTIERRVCAHCCDLEVDEVYDMPLGEYEDMLDQPGYDRTTILARLDAKIKYCLTRRMQAISKLNRNAQLHALGIKIRVDSATGTFVAIKKGQIVFKSDKIIHNA